MRRNERGRQSFVALNAGKEMVTIDLASDEGRRAAMALAAVSDVVVDNLRPGVLEKFGLGFQTLREIHPGVVYCSISGYGRGAPGWRHRPAYDHVIQAASGMAWMGGNEGDPPVKTGFPVIDSATGVQAAMAVLAALRERERTGTGMLVDVSMAAAGLQLMYPMTCDALTNGSTPPRVGNQGYSGSPAADFFRTRDGWLALGANTPRQLLSLLRVLDLAHLAGDARLFAQPLDGALPPAFVRSLNPEALKQALAEAVAQCDGAELEARLNAAHVPAARLRDIAEFAGEASESGSIRTVDLIDDGVMVRSPGIGFGIYR